MTTRCIKVLISGHVQGVFFRDSTRNKANRYSISGHAKNLSDGRVEVIACGEFNDIEQIIDWLHIGPVYSRVDKISIQEIDINSPDGFHIL